MNRLLPLPAGTRHPNPKYSRSYTVEQYATLAEVKVPDLVPGMARPEFVNAAILPDGTIVRDAALPLMSTAKERAEAALVGNTMDPAVLLAATEVARKLQEVITHLGEQRFLFIVDEQFSPVVYFPCVVAESPDAPTA